jgi:hypothetical protein
VSFLTKSLLPPLDDYKHRLKVVSDRLLHCGIQLVRRLRGVAAALMLRCTQTSLPPVLYRDDSHE